MENFLYPCLLFAPSEKGCSYSSQFSKPTLHLCWHLWAPADLMPSMSLRLFHLSVYLLIYCVCEFLHTYTSTRVRA